MKVWTIQTPDVLTKLERDGVWHADASHVEASWQNAYQWMTEQLAQRAGPPPRGVTTPIWVWRQWRNAERPIPDLRATGHLPRGERGVRLELDVDPGRVLLSDFEQWHYVLNYWYLPRVVAEGERFERLVRSRDMSFYQTKPLPDPDLHAQIVASWERCFDLDWYNRSLSAKRSEKMIQGVMWTLRIEDVCRVTKFVAR